LGSKIGHTRWYHAEDFLGKGCTLQEKSKSKDDIFSLKEGTFLYSLFPLVYFFEKLAIASDIKNKLLWKHWKDQGW
jgi:hypothetical protein